MQPSLTPRSTALVAVLLGASLVACSGEPPAAKKTAPAPSAVTCTSRPRVRDGDLCGTVTVGARTYRYALMRTTGSRRETIVVDPGGPGISALAHNGVRALVQTYAGEVSQQRNVLVLEEPWVTAPVLPECDTAVSQYYRSFSSGQPSHSAAMQVRDKCELAAPGRYGLAADYASILSAIAQRDGLVLEGFVGASFGSVRLDYAVQGGIRFRWAVLVRPYPVDTPMAELHAARAEAVDLAFPAQAMPAARLESGPSATPADVVAARVASGQLGDLPRTQEQVIDRARGLWQAYGVDSISYSLLAYWDEVCRLSTPDSAGSWDGSAADTRGFLASFHAPCDGLGPVEERAATPKGFSAPRLCVVSAAKDSVTPGALVHASYRRKAEQWVESAESAHTSVDGIARCIRSVQAS